MTQMLLEDAIKRGHAEAAVCTENTRKDDSDWPEKAFAALEDFCYKVKTYGTSGMFDAEQASSVCELACGTPRDHRAWGAIFAKAAGAGIIKKSNQTYRRTKGHGSPAFMWEVV